MQHIMPANAESRPDEAASDIAAMAAMEFQPWDKDGHGNPDMIREHAPKHLTNACVAFGLLCLTKQQLVELMRDEQDAFRDIYKDIEDSASAFRAMGDMLNGATVRMLCATSVILQEAA